MLVFRRKLLFISKKMREPMKENTLILTTSFFFFHPNLFFPARFVLCVTTANPIFFLR